MYFDSHTHLNDGRFEHDQDEVITKAYNEGIKLMMLPGADLESSQSAVALANKYPYIYAAVGIHPHDTESMDELTLGLIKSLSRDQKVRADHYGIGVIMHCFSGRAGLARAYLKRGSYISLAGPVTFKNARKAVEVAEMVPMDRLLIETDSPYLAPTPYRGKRNEPLYVKHVAERIAEIRGFDVEYVAQKTFENAKRAFGIE